jgi:hypothetical protein
MCSQHRVHSPSPTMAFIFHLKIYSTDRRAAYDSIHCLEVIGANIAEAHQVVNRLPPMADARLEPSAAKICSNNSIYVYAPGAPVQLGDQISGISTLR